MKRKTLDLGSISSGTLRPEDIIPELMSAGETVRMAKADRRKFLALCKEFNALDFTEDPDWTAAETAADLQEEFYSILESYTPDYCYIGSSEGDGACIGVWPVSELFTSSTRDGGYDGCITRDEDLTASQARQAGYSHRLSVNDHGNATLYRVSGNRWVEVWAIV